MQEYGSILFLLLLSIIIALVLFLVSFTMITKQTASELRSSYECGFDPFSDTRNRFDVRFYLVSILFIIFDLEIIFLFPWAITLGYLDLWGFLLMVLFLMILTLGFIFEWLKGALEWE